MQTERNHQTVLGLSLVALMYFFKRDGEQSYRQQEMKHGKSVKSRISLRLVEKTSTNFLSEIGSLLYVGSYEDERLSQNAHLRIKL